MAKTLAERLKEPKVRAEIQRDSAKLTAEEYGWVVMEPKRARALLAVARAAKALDRTMSGPEWQDVLEGRSDPLRRALARLDKVGGSGRGT